MSKYTFTYFDAKALGDSVRLLLSYGKQDFKDVRIDYEKEWPKMKESTPAGQLPLLQIDDKVYDQSTAISRFLGKKYGLAGKNDLESLEIDIAVDTLQDLRSSAANAFYDTDETSKENKYKVLEATTFPVYIKKLEALATINNGHLACKKLTWADFMLTGVGDYLCRLCRQDIFANNPNLKSVVDNVQSLPSSKAWYAKAPKCEI